jgi:uncharacterized membrane protein YhaH (DUF805 family)
MLQLFSFLGRMRPRPYLLSSLAVFFSQHLITILVIAAEGGSLGAAAKDWQFYLMPLQTLAKHSGASALTLLLALTGLLIACWALAALAFRRAADAEVSGWIAAFAIAPVVQIATIGLLSAMPSRAVAGDAGVMTRRGPLGWATAAQGLFLGVGVTLFAVATGALLFGSYGFGIFVASPFTIGATTGYFANRRADLSPFRTAELVAGAIFLGGVALLIAALEGLICILMAAPLAMVAALVGGMLGRAIALYSRGPARQGLSAVALLPVIFALETSLPTAVPFDTLSRLQIGAPPPAVWKVLVRTDLSEEPVALPFRLGLAYPVRGEVLGQGIGSIRLGEFSTGVALERVTEWIPNRKLSFILLNEVPAMRELSPYAKVHAPHVVGYFRTTNTSFELLDREDGNTEVIERTSHLLSLEPVLYWLPLARWVVHENNARVLAHIKHRAEASQAIND